MRSTKVSLKVEVSKDNLVAWISAGLNQMRALQGINEAEVYDIDYVSGWRGSEGIQPLTIYAKKKEAERYINGQKG